MPPWNADGQLCARPGAAMQRVGSGGGGPWRTLWHRPGISDPLCAFDDRGRCALIGGGASFESQVGSVLDALYDFACALAPAPEADDLTQAACLRALEHYVSFRDGTSFKTWIFTIL